MSAFPSGRVLSFTSSKPKATVKTPYSLFQLLCFVTTAGFDYFFNLRVHGDQGCIIDVYLFFSFFLN